MRNARDWILGAVIAFGIVLVCAVGFLAGIMYLGSKAWERSWAKVQVIQGPDGYTYCLMHETGLGQDPHTKLSRTKTPEDESSYEDLGQVNETSSRLPVIRPVALARRTNKRLHITAGNKIFINCYDLGNHVPFVYDIGTNQFYEDHVNNQVPPFILIDGAEVRLYEPDVAAVVERVREDFESYVEQKEYVTSLIKAGKAPADYVIEPYVPEWPAPEALAAGLAHPNKEVQKVAEWLLQIRQNGLGDGSEMSREIKKFLEKNQRS